MWKDRLRGARSGLERRVRSKLEAFTAKNAETAKAHSRFGASDQTALAQSGQNHGSIETSPEDPPVVARLMVEIRSDGTRTVARGALKDELNGEQVSLVAQGSTPLALAAQLAKSLLTTPLAAGRLARAMRRAQLREESQSDEPDPRPSPDAHAQQEKR